MHRKQNRDPNRSNQTSYTHLEKKHLSQHNSSLNTISATQQYIPISKQNKNSQILAEIKQSKNLISSKQSKQQGIKTSLSTTRNNYKPRFILKDLMQQKDLESHQNDTESRCEEYFMELHHEDNNMSSTFNNSPLASEAYYRFNGKQVRAENGSEITQGRNKSAILSKRSYLEDESKRHQEHENTRQYDMPFQTKKNTKLLRKTEENQEDENTVPEFYEQASTIQYNQKYPQNNQKSFLETPVPLSFQPRIRSISTSNIPQNGSSPRNYKTSYLETKKQLEIKSAYFNQAIQLCRHIIGNMKSTLEDEYEQNESEKVMWCHERCEDILKVFEEWKKE